MLQITSDERCELRARAQGLNPVVTISQNGLTEAVMNEIGASLKAHELIKIRVFNDEREIRESYLNTICEQLEAAAVQHIGKLLIIWRPKLEDETTNKPQVRRRKAPRRTKSSFQGN